jgi:hypothetical protein
MLARSAWTSSTITPACSPSRVISTFPRTATSGSPGRPPRNCAWPCDYQRINYSDVNSINNASLVAVPSRRRQWSGFRLVRRGCLETGCRIQAQPGLDLPRRLQPCATTRFRRADVTFNILAPARGAGSCHAGFHQHPAVGRRVEHELHVRIRMRKCLAHPSFRCSRVGIRRGPKPSRCTNGPWASNTAGKCNPSAGFIS